MLCVVAVLSCGEVGGGARAKRYVGLYTGPYFDPSAPNNITTQLGTHAYLPCKVSLDCFCMRVRRAYSFLKGRNALLIGDSSDLNGPQYNQIKTI